MAYLYLTAAILFEVLGIVTMKQSEGLTKVAPSILTIVFHGISFISLTVALKSLPISMVYAIWAGVGTAMMAFIGLFIFHEPLPFQKVFATALIIVGVVILNLSDRTVIDDQVAKVDTPKVEVTAESAARTVAVSQRNSG